MDWTREGREAWQTGRGPRGRVCGVNDTPGSEGDVGDELAVLLLLLLGSDLGSSSALEGL